MESNLASTLSLSFSLSLRFVDSRGNSLVHLVHFDSPHTSHTHTPTHTHTHPHTHTTHNTQQHTSQHNTQHNQHNNIQHNTRTPPTHPFLIFVPFFRQRCLINMIWSSCSANMGQTSTRPTPRVPALPLLLLSSFPNIF